MRKLALSIIVALGFGLPVMAGELECPTNSTPPAAEFVQLIVGQYPELTEPQAIVIAKGFEYAYQVETEFKTATTDEKRQLAQRNEQLVLRIIATELHVFKTLPQMESVVKRMEAEELAGLKRVSAELEPDVRATAHEMIAFASIWREISAEANAIAIDRALAAAGDSSVHNTTKFIQQAQRSLCLIKASMEVMNGVADLLPSAILLAHVKHLNY